MITIRKQELTLDDVITGIDKIEATTTLIQRALSGLTLLLQTSLPFSGSLPYIGVLIVFLLLLLDTISLALDTTKPIATRIFKGTLAAAIVLTAIAALAVAAVFLNYIITASIAARRLWDVGVAFFDWLNTITPRDENHKRELRSNLAENLHMLVLSALSITALVLMTNPVTFIAGISLLIGVAAYMVVDKFLVINKINYNPVRWLGRLIFGDALTAPEKVELKSDRIIETAPFNTKSIFEASKVEPSAKKSPVLTSKQVVAKPVEKPAVYNSIFGQRLGSKIIRRLPNVMGQKLGRAL